MRKEINSLTNAVLIAGGLWLLNVLNLNYNEWYISLLSYIILTLVSFNILRSIYKLIIAYRNRSNQGQ
ncbi:MAG: hypothetical protein ACEPOV_07315 [Hyphomicrobiales bacterium]